MNAPKFANRTTVIILLIVGGVAFMLMLFCGGAAFLGFKGVKSLVGDFQAMQATGDAFFDDLAAGQIAAAYGRTTTTFQSVQSLPQFTTWVQTFPALTTATSRQYSNFHINNGRGTLRGTVLGPNNSLSFTMHLAPEGGQWKVQSLSVP